MAAALSAAAAALRGESPPEPEAAALSSSPHASALAAAASIYSSDAGLSRAPGAASERPGRAGGGEMPALPLRAVFAHADVRGARMNAAHQVMRRDWVWVQKAALGGLP